MGNCSIVFWPVGSSGAKITNLLLFHKLGVWAIINDIAAEYRCREGGVDFFSADISKFSVEDEVVSCCSDVDSSLLAEQDESEDITVLKRHMWLIKSYY